MKSLLQVYTDLCDLHRDYYGQSYRNKTKAALRTLRAMFDYDDRHVTVLGEYENVIHLSAEEEERLRAEMLKAVVPRQDAAE